jgi:isoleucyl-tRNA synthetase
MMMIKLLEFSKEVTAAYDKFDLKDVYEKILEFMVREVSDFYLDFTKYRRRRILHQGQEKTPNDGTLDVLHNILNAILVTGAPIVPFTSQEAFDHLYAGISTKPRTVFHLPWHTDDILVRVDTDVLSRFEVRDQYKILRELRERIRDQFEDKGILDAVSKRNYQNT